MVTSLIPIRESFLPRKFPAIRGSYILLSLINYALYVQEEDSEDDVVDSDFDVDESTWNQEEDGEKQLQLMEQKKKRKQWLKPTKPKVSHQPAVVEYFGIRRMAPPQ